MMLSSPVSFFGQIYDEMILMYLDIYHDIGIELVLLGD